MVMPQHPVLPLPPPSSLPPRLPYAYTYAYTSSSIAPFSGDSSVSPRRVVDVYAYVYVYGNRILADI